MTSSSNQFGLLVAYLLPGFIVLAGIAPLSPLVAAWLQPLNQAQASLGAPVYAVLAAIAIGMIVSCFRWLLIDHVHYWTGVKPPAWDDSRLEERVIAFNYLVENHYRYFQFYANTLVAILLTYSINRLMGTSPVLGSGTDLGILLVSLALFAGSRDSLRKYYARTDRLIGQLTEKGDVLMTNGNHQDSGGNASSTQDPAAKRHVKSDSQQKPPPPKPTNVNPSK